MAVHLNWLIQAGAEGLAKPGLFGIDSVDHAHRDGSANGNLGSVRILLRRRRISLLTRRFLFLSLTRWRTRVLGRESLATAELQHTAWQIQGSWVLTGEDAGYDGVTPRRPFDPRNGHWGALQLVARYSELDVNNAAFPLFSDPDTSASSAHAWSVGLNWYLNRNLRFNASYSHTTFQGGGGAGLVAPATTTRQPEQVLFTRLQLGF